MLDKVWIVAIGVVVAAFIGGMTNYLAIRMLFRPRTKWVIGGFHIPFTPGLIPKRREEIADSLGRVVADYLVTSSGLTVQLRSEQFRQMVTDKLMDYARRLASEEKVLGDFLQPLVPEWSRADMEAKVSEWLRELARGGLHDLWVDKGGAKKRVGELIPQWSAVHREELAGRGTIYIAEALRSWLHTPEGEEMILRMTTQFIEQAGGFLGAMAAIFVDEYKTAIKVRQMLSGALTGDAVLRMLRQLLESQLEKIEQLTLEEVVRALSTDTDDEAGVAGIERFIAGLPFERMAEELTMLRVDKWIARYMDVLEAKAPALVASLLQLIERNIDRIFAAIRLEQLVKTQVQAFPIERLERIILNISGSEFRAITWLGAFLGGFIGLLQGIFVQWLS